MGGLLTLFPGQGSQAPGMAEHLWGSSAAREAFAEAGDVLGLGHRRALPPRSDGGTHPDRPDTAHDTHLQRSYVEGS